MKIYDYKLTKPFSWCLVLCISLFFMTTSTFAQVVEDITCDDQVNISVGENCTFKITPGLFTEGTNTEMTVYFSNAPAVGYPVGSDVELECGTYTVTVAGVSGNSCWGTVVVEDKLPPQSVNPCEFDDLGTPEGCEMDCFTYASGTWDATAQSAYTGSLTDCSEPLGGLDPIGPTILVRPAVECEDANGALNPDTLLMIYSVADAKGNVASDTLWWLVTKLDVMDLTFPATFEGDCDSERCPGVEDDPSTPLVNEAGPDAPSITLPDGTTVELGAAAFDNNADCSSGTAQVCDLLFSYEDIELPACDSDCSSSKKIIRNWRVLDWCRQISFGPRPQIIHLKDNTPPTIVDTEGDTDFSVDPWLCLVERVTLPTPIITDNCDTDGFDVTIVGPPGVVISNGVALNVPKGVHSFFYYATDCCGNVSAAYEVIITVVDGVAPVAIAKQFTVISLSNVPGENEGLAKMYAESLDNGSYDRCTDVRLEIRRDGLYDADNGSDDLDYTQAHSQAGVDFCCGPNNPNCVSILKYPCDQVGNDTYNTDYQRNADGTYVLDGNGDRIPIYNGHSWDLPAGCNTDIDPDDGRYVKFCCADLEAETVDVNYDGVNDQGYVKVWLRVWDNADMSMDPQGNPTYGTAGDFYNETWGYVKVEVSKPPILTVENATINCDWPWEEKLEEGFFGYPETDEVNGGTITDWMRDYLTWEGICSVDIYLDSYSDFYFDDVCREGYITLNYRAKNPDSKGLEVRRSQTVWVTNLDRLVCDDIAWPPSFTEADCTATNDEPYLEWEANACSLIGWTYRSDTFRFESDACVKIINEYTVIDWCRFDETHPGFGFGYQDTDYNNDYDDRYFEGGNDYFDGLLCEDPTLFGYTPDTEDSDNGVYKYIEVIKIDDDIAPEIEVQDTMYAITTLECERTIQLEASATDNSDDDCPATWFKWEITFDWNENGIFTDDYTYTRDRFGNPLRGDEENPGNIEFVPYDWTSNSFPRPMISFAGPMGNWNVQYIVFDGCGNVDKEVQNVMITDKKAPTPYCVSLSSALMVNNRVELWAVDFNVGSADNCTDQDDLLYTFYQENPVLSKIGQVHFFKGAGEDASEAEYLEGDAQQWRPAGDYGNGYTEGTSAKIFDCDDLAASPVDVEMTVWDSKLNFDWCSVELTLINNQGDCTGVGSRAAVSGNIATEENGDVSQVEVTLENLSNPEYELTVSTGNDGDFAFASNPMYNGYDISAVKDGDDTEGVSTLDLVLIQRHILGITSFDSPYKVIAADINSDRRVSGTDLVVLRKTILGIYKEFPTNNSWRFVERAQTLTVDNALTDFNEVINISDLDANMLNEDFTAVKIGDVNATAKTNARDLGTQTRSAGTLTIGLEEQNVAEGQSIDLTFSSNDFNKVYGYQFTLELNGLTIVSVESGDANMSEANIGILDENTVTVSYSDMEGLGTSNNLFTLSAVATQSGTISNMISLTNSVLNSEGYVGEGLDIHTVDLTINGEDAQTFRLDQNEPNPFDEVTVVGFELPSSGNATLTVYDVAGKIVTTVRGAYAQGYNEIKLNKEDLNTTGVLYYTLKSGEFSATKKMIIIE